MEKFIFIQGTPPAGFALNFPGSLFNTAAHRHLQSLTHWTSFYILNESSKGIEGFFHAHVNGTKAESPYRAPFGSIEFSESLPPGVLLDFIGFIDHSLLHDGVMEIKIKMPPLAYSPTAISCLKEALTKKRYQVELAEVGSVIYVRDVDFKSIIKDSERLVLNQYDKKDFVCIRLPIDNIESVYDFISKHQVLKGYAMSMALDELRNTVQVFNDDFFLFVVLDHQKIIAASVSIKVMDHVLYNFYLAHDAAYNKYSPAIAIIEALYSFCKKNSMSILDLGTSMLNDKPNIPLLNFKQRIGGVVTEKLTLCKKLA